jgi:hypothetical protein
VLEKKVKELQMKVHMIGFTPMFSGRDGDLVYYYNSKTRKSTVRKYLKPKQNEHHDRMAAVSFNLKNLNISKDYKRDLKWYCSQYNIAHSKKNSCFISFYAMFMKLMWAMSKKLGIDLATVTREQIENDNLPCRTVHQAVDAGLIPNVRNYLSMTNQM